MPTLTNNNIPGVHRKEWEMMTPFPVASVAGSFVVTDTKETDGVALSIFSATSQYLYHHDEDGAVQIPSLALAGVFGAGACGCKMRWSNTLTANGGSNTTVTTTATISGLANGKKVRFLTGASAGKEATVTGVIINPGGTSTLQFADIGSAVANTDTFMVETGLFMILSAYATLAAGVFKSYDPLTGVTTSLGTTNLPAAWGTDGRIVATTSDDIFESGTSSGSNTTTSLNHTGKTWGVNQWTNSQVRITGGLGIGQVRNIASNTASQLVPSVAWTTTPDGTSTYEITANDDNLYLLGNNAVTVYKYSRSGNTWAVMAPTTARAAAPGSGMSANWAGKTGDTNWANISDIKDGRYIYSFRGGGSSALDRLDLAWGTAGAGAWAAIAYINQAETFTTGSSFGCNGRYIYCRKDATHRYFKYSMRGNYMEPLTTNLYTDGAALVGDKTWIWNYQEAGVTKLSYLYSLRNTGTELHRMALI